MAYSHCAGPGQVLAMDKHNRKQWILVTSPSQTGVNIAVQHIQGFYRFWKSEKSGRHFPVREKSGNLAFFF